MPYMIAVSLEMSDEPYYCSFIFNLLLSIDNLFSMGHFSIQIYANFSRQQNVLVINFQMVMCNIYREKAAFSTAFPPL